MNTQRQYLLPVIYQLSRPQAIEEIRRIINAMPADEESCACAVTARYDIFCKGFSRYSDQEFRQRFHWIVSKHPGSSREDLERLAGFYHRGRQEVSGKSLCCDVETRERCGCDGWNTFDNVAIEDYYYKLTGREARVA